MCPSVTARKGQDECSNPSCLCPEPKAHRWGPVHRPLLGTGGLMITGGRTAFKDPECLSSLSPTHLDKKTCACIPHLDMILFSFSIKTKTTTTKARKRAYLLLILRLCRKSRQSWGKASPFSMGKGGAVGARLRGITQGLAPCLQVGDTLVLWRHRLSGHSCLQMRRKRALPPGFRGSQSCLAARTPEALS